MRIQESKDLGPEVTLLGLQVEAMSGAWGSCADRFGGLGMSNVSSWSPDSKKLAFGSHPCVP